MPDRCLILSKCYTLDLPLLLLLQPQNLQFYAYQSCLVIEVLAAWAKFLEPFGYLAVIICASICCIQWLYLDKQRGICTHKKYNLIFLFFDGDIRIVQESSQREFTQTNKLLGIRIASRNWASAKILDLI